MVESETNGWHWHLSADEVKAERKTILERTPNDDPARWSAAYDELVRTLERTYSPEDQRVLYRQMCLAAAASDVVFIWAAVLSYLDRDLPPDAPCETA